MKTTIVPSFPLLTLRPEQRESFNKRFENEKRDRDQYLFLYQEKTKVILDLKEKKTTIPLECVIYEQEFITIKEIYDKHVKDNLQRSRTIEENILIIIKINKRCKQQFGDIISIINPKILYLEEINQSLQLHNDQINEICEKMTDLTQKIKHCKYFISSYDSLLLKEKKELQMLKFDLDKKQNMFDVIRKLLLVITWLPKYIEYAKNITIDYNQHSEDLYEEHLIEACNEHRSFCLMNEEVRPSIFHWRCETEQYSISDIDIFNIESISLDTIFYYKLRSVSYNEYLDYAIENRLDSGYDYYDTESEFTYFEEELFMKCNQHRQEYLFDNYYVSGHDLYHRDKIDCTVCHGWDLNDARCSCGCKFYWITDGFNPTSDQITIKSNKPFGYVSNTLF